MTSSSHAPWSPWRLRPRRSHRLSNLLAALVFGLAGLSPSLGAAQELWPGTTYDPAIPTTRQLLGHDPGAAITSPPDIVRYLQALAAAAPDRARLIEYGRTWEGRPLVALVIASAERIRTLEAIKQDLRRLADPRGLPAAELDALVRRTPVVTALLHNVHGNEISSAGAALAEAHHLLAARGDATVDLILAQSIVLIDPLQNPDGRARFVSNNLLGQAMAPDPDPVSAEHDEPWPGGRSNHYLFDLNRDWFAQSQRESAARVRLLLAFAPHIVVDLHEMGGDSTYYFPPSAQPTNPLYTAQQHALLDLFGRANAARFDARGFRYFNREVFDAFYPGYGVSWPLLQGAVGMTFEKASARGLVYRREDGGLLTYGDGVREHFTAAVTTMETAARHRERILREFVAFRQSAVDEGAKGAVREYLVRPGSDRGATMRLARRLVRNGIEVRVLEEPLKSGAQTAPAGSLLISPAQPAGRLVRNLLDQDVPIEARFLARQDERRQARRPDEIYDVTAWSLALLGDLDVVTLAAPVTARTRPFTIENDHDGDDAGDSDDDDASAGGTRGRATAAASASASTAAAAAATTALPRAQVGYLLPWSVSTAAATAEALRAGIRVEWVGGAFTIGGRRFPLGTAVVRVPGNPADLATRLGAIARKHDAEVVPIDSAFADEGSSLGSNLTKTMKMPRVLLAWDAPTQSLSAGWARYALERQYGLAATAVRVGSFGRADLSRYDVIVLPSGSYGGALNAEAVRRLRAWVANGGTLITLAEASRWAARADVGLLDTASELRGGVPDTDAPAKPFGADGAAAATQPIDPQKAIEPLRERPFAITGAIVRVLLDTEHWLAAGTDGELQAMLEGDRIFTPIRLDKGRNVGRYAGVDRLTASGLIWDAAKAQLAHKAFVIDQPVGRGHVIAFAEDPNFRAYTEASSLLFVNAVLLGPVQ